VSHGQDQNWKLIYCYSYIKLKISLNRFPSVSCFWIQNQISYNQRTEFCSNFPNTPKNNSHFFMFLSIDCNQNRKVFAVMKVTSWEIEYIWPNLVTLMLMRSNKHNGKWLVKLTISKWLRCLWIGLSSYTVSSARAYRIRLHIKIFRLLLKLLDCY